MNRLPLVQRLANFACDLGDWPVVVTCAFAVGAVIALAMTGQL